MAFITFFFGSGLAFFVGMSLVCLAFFLRIQSRWRRLRRLTPLCVVLGATLITLSATPFPYWLYAVFAVVTVVWLYGDRWLEKRTRIGLWLLRLTAVLVWIGVVAMELPYHLTPRVPAVQQQALWIVADSVTAGVADPKVQTWPGLLAKQHNVVVHDFSQPGETLGSALRTVARNPVGSGVVLLEIGGNDMLGSTTDDDFEDRLDRLLAQVSGQGQVVVMFELPLPPFRNALGMAQRRLAAKHGAILIPKRLFVDILTTEGATIDGIHLTQEGQNRMEELVWRVVAPAFEK